MIYFFWNRWFRNTLKPIVDNNKTDKLKIIEAECKKEVEIKAPEKGKAEKELQIKNEEKHNFISLNSDDLGAPVPANQIKDTNLNGALAPRKDATALNNNLEENNMGILGSKVKKFFCGAEKSESAVQTEQPAPAPQVLPPNISNIIMRSNNDSNNSINLDDINDSNEYLNVDKKALNAMGSKIKQEIKKDMDDRFAENTNDMNNLKEQVNKNTEDIKEVNKKVDKIQEEQIDIKKMIAELKISNQKHDEMIADNKIRIKKAEETLAEMKQQTAEMKEMRKNQEKQYAEQNAKWMEMFGPYLKKKPRSSRNDNRESTNTSFSSFHGYMNMNNSQIPKMERADMAHSHGENQ